MGIYKSLFILFFAASGITETMSAKNNGAIFINGFSELIEINGEVKEWYIDDREFLSYRGRDRSWQVRATDGRESITWRTDEVPTDIGSTVIFVFGAGFTIGELGRFEFMLDNQSLMTISGTISGDAQWQNEQVHLKFDYFRNQSSYAAGVMYITIPAEMLTPGEPVRFSVRGLKDDDSSSFFLNDNKSVANDPDIQPVVNPKSIEPLEPVTAKTLRYEGTQPVQVFNRPKGHYQQGLETLLSRGRVKPVELLANKDEKGRTEWVSERTIFHDEFTGTEIWKMTNSPYGVVRHEYSTLHAWNANGRKILVNLPFGAAKGMIDQRTGKIYQSDNSYPGVWSPVDPDIMFKPGQWKGKPAIVSYNVEKDEVLQGLAPVRENQTAGLHFPPSDDAKYIIWREGPQGRSPTFGLAATDGSLYRSISLSGKVIDEQLPVTFEEPAKQPGLDETTGGVHQQYFTRRPDHSVIIASNYFRPDEPTYSLERIYSIDGELKYTGPNMSHQSWHKKGEYVIFMGWGGVTAYDPLSGKRWLVMPYTGTVDGHTTWNSYDAHWSAASLRSQGGGDIFRISMRPDRSVIRLAGSNPVNPDATNWNNHEFANLSPDGTKILFMSTMSGSLNEYIAIAANPQAPKLVGEWTDDAYQLTIDPALSRETKGYRLYRTDRTGQNYIQLDFIKKPDGNTVGSEEPFSILIEDSSSEDGSYYAVRAEEHSGLLSRYSNEVSVNDAPTAKTIEVESLEFTGFMQDFNAQEAGNMYYLFVPSYAPNSSVTFNNPLIAGTVWARVTGKEVSYRLDAGDVSIDYGPKNYRGWEWVNLGSLQGEITLTSESAGLQIDRFFITPDPEQKPVGRGLDYQPDLTFAGKIPGNVQANALSPFAVEITWKPVGGARHYNVYVCDQPDFKPSQAKLIYSPPGIGYNNGNSESGRIIDWGIESGAQLYYKVEAVDFDGTRSRISEAAGAVTPELKLETLELNYNEFAGETIESIEGKSAEDGRLIILEEGQSVEVPFNIQTEGDYVIWHQWRADSGDFLRIDVSLSEESKGITDYHSLQMSKSYDLSALSGIALSEEPGWNRFTFRGDQVETGSNMEHGVMRLTSGSYTLKLTANDQIYLHKLKITNDLNLVPDGRLNTF